MKKQKMFLILSLLFFCMLLPIQGFAADKVDFKTYDKGIALAKKLNKKVFVFFHADWCKYCHKMEKETLSNIDVINYLNKNYISILIDTEHEKELAKKYKAWSLPLLYFLREDGSALSSRRGYLNVKNFLYTLQYINTESYKKGISFTDFVNQN